MSTAVRLKKKPATRKTLLSLLAKAMSANPKFGGKFKVGNFDVNTCEVLYSPIDLEYGDPTWDGYEFYQNDDFPYCCGLNVIGEFDNGTGDPVVDTILLRIQLAEAKDNFIAATVVRRDQPAAYDMLIGAGFQVMAVWKNVNTGNEITMFGWNRATAKALPIS